MAAITYGSHAPAQAPAFGATEKKAVPQTSAPKASFFHRLWIAMMEARMRQAMTEIRLHQHLLPAEYEIAGNRLIYKNEDQLPFVRTRG
jgi:hypothetical protein